MQLKTILNRVQRFKSFVYGSVRWANDAEEPAIEVELHARANSRGICSGCARRRPGYDRLSQRCFEFIPFWGLKVFFLYAPRRVECGRCGIRVERMPWVSGKRQLTESYAWFLAGWAKRLSWSETARAFRTTWDQVFSAVRMAVMWGRKHQNLEAIEAIGVDEIARQRGHRYLTLVYQIDFRMSAAVVDWPGEESRDAAEVLSVAGHRANREAAIYLQRYVEALSEGYCRQGEPCASHTGSVPHHGANE